MKKFKEKQLNEISKYNFPKNVVAKDVTKIWKHYFTLFDKFQNELIEKICSEFEELVIEDKDVIVETPEYKFARKLVNSKINDKIKEIKENK